MDFPFYLLYNVQIEGASMSIITFAAGVAVGYLFPKAVYTAYTWAASKITGK